MPETIDEGLFLSVAGLEQWVTIRGRDRANPALMILTGAGAAFSALAPVFAPWEERFTLVQWDQPGAGATLAANPDDQQPLTYDRLARDGGSVVEAVCTRLGVPKLSLFAISGGSVTGLRMLRAGPERIAAYVGNGQVTHWRRQEALAYRIMLEQAEGDAAATAELTAIGPPPWADVAAELAKSR
ncbi:MAG TPA: alpha/beta hydrolase, partial [Phenylobacterium sp.]